MLMRFLISFLFLSMVLFAKDTLCSVCQNKITGNYLKSDSGEVYCSNNCAATKLPPCAVCGKKNKQSITIEKKNYCSRECASKAGLNCKVCNKSIFGEQYLKTAKGDFFCSQKCYFITIGKCAICADKTLNMAKMAGSYFCTKCMKLEKCNGCGLPSKGSKISDGREICGSCQNLGMNDSEKANKMYLEIKKMLAGKFKIETTEDLPFSLIDKAELLKIRPNTSNMDRGLYRQNEVSNEKGVKHIKDRHIYILSYLPENHFRNVVAHELMHNWQANNYPQITDLKLIEGLAEYLAYLFNLEENDEDLAQRKLENQDSIYGEGFRMVKEWDQGNGIQDIKDKLIELYGKPKQK